MKPPRQSYEQSEKVQEHGFMDRDKKDMPPEPGRGPNGPEIRTQSQKADSQPFLGQAGILESTRRRMDSRDSCKAIWRQAKLNRNPKGVVHPQTIALRLRLLLLRYSSACLG
jgi:hypothetical protein